ncbi:MAG: hypothetical protein HC930_02885 [Hydrococcus sp. SU_1_0]|nr:hypothetical protein [Hydrococcus sp. SU_1_0]
MFISDQELNHAVATQLNDWVHDEGIFYHDSTGVTCYLADYCNSAPHALDVAKAHGVSLLPVADGWTACKIDDPTSCATDAVASRAIVVATLMSIGFAVSLAE